MYLKMIVPFLAVILAVESTGLVGGPVVGGVVDADMDEGARSALQFAMAEYNKHSNDAFFYRVSKVVKVQKQVVSGMNYFFTVKMVRTSCRKGAGKLCVIYITPKQVTQCKITVWSQPWLNSMKVTEHTCM